MGNVIEVDFSENSAFQEEMNDIIDDFVSCLGRHYGDEAGHLMAKSFTVCLEEIASRVTKQLEVMEAENEPSDTPAGTVVEEKKVITAELIPLQR